MCAAFSGYLGGDSKDAWKLYDACELLKAYSGRKMPILCDTGTADGFYKVRYAYDTCMRTEHVIWITMAVPACELSS